MDIHFFYGWESQAAAAYHKSVSALAGLTAIKDVAPIVRILASKDRWITNQTFFANGGYTTR